MKRILVIIGDIARGGGAQRVATTLSNQLRSLGYDTHVLTFYHFPDSHPVDGVYHTFNERPARNFFDYGLKLIQRSWKIRNICREHRFDLTISFLEEANLCALFSKIAFFNRMPMVVSIRNNALKKPASDRAIIRYFYPFADSVVAVSCGVEDILKKEFGLKRTTTIYNPIDLESVRRKAAEPLPEEFRWIERRAPLYVTAGRLTKQKGHWHLIRAFQEVVQRKPDATLLILGNGELQAKLERLTQDCGLAQNVFLAGYQANIFPFLAAADCFVFSSLWEGMPNALLDALAVGLPILSTDCLAGPREILAPGLPLDEPIRYPHQAGANSLIAPLVGKEVYSPVGEVPLSSEESMLAEEMLRFDPQPRPRPEPGPPTRFQMEAIISQWRQIF